MKRAPTLALLTLDFAPDVGGVQSYLYETAHRLAEWAEITVITPIADPGTSDKGFERIVLLSPSVNAFRQTVRHLQPDLVLVGHAHPKLLLAAKLVGDYGLITYGNDYLAGQRRWHRRLFNRLIRSAKPLITISQANLRKLNALGIDPDVVIYPGTDPQRFSPRKTAVTKPPTLLTVARLVPRKGIDTVIESLPALLQAHPALQYHVCGQGPDLERLRSLANRLGVSSAVHFLGRVTDTTLPEVYRTADIFVMPAREEAQHTSVEGFGIVFLEASASGLPIVASRSGGISDAVLDGETGWLLSNANVTELSKALSDLLDSPEKRMELGKNGRRWVEQQMNWDQTAMKLARALGIDLS